MDLKKKFTRLKNKSRKSKKEIDKISKKNMLAITNLLRGEYEQ